MSCIGSPPAIYAGNGLNTRCRPRRWYMRLFADARRPFSDRVHFLSVASRVMRQVLVDYARARSAWKRGGEMGLELPDGEADVKPLDLLELDRALAALAGEDPSLAQLIEMRYFAGMTAEEIAEALGQSVHVVRHDVRLAHAWLRRNLSRQGGIRS